MGKISIHYSLTDKRETVLMPAGLVALMKIMLTCVMGRKFVEELSGLVT